MELTYTQCGDYLIPDLALSGTKEYHIGKYGRMRSMNSIHNRAEEIVLAELIYG